MLATLHISVVMEEVLIGELPRLARLGNCKIWRTPTPDRITAFGPFTLSEYKGEVFLVDGNNNSFPISDLRLNQFWKMLKD